MPGGSSTGPTVSIAAGYAPLAIGTDTIGSLITPTVRQALYAIKPTIGKVDNHGILGISPFFDNAGPIAKSAKDLQLILEVIINSPLQPVPQNINWTQISAGFADPDVWKMWDSVCRQHEGTFEQMVSFNPK
jgi:amidase